MSESAGLAHKILDNARWATRAGMYIGYYMQYTHNYLSPDSSRITRLLRNQSTSCGCRRGQDRLISDMISRLDRCPCCTRAPDLNPTVKPQRDGGQHSHRQPLHTPLREHA